MGALGLQSVRSLIASASKPRIVVALPGLAFLVALLLPCPGAGAQADWVKLPRSEIDALSEPAVLRLGDGSLDVAYRTPGRTPDTQALATSLVSPIGRVVPGPMITGDWVSLNDPALVSSPDGRLRAFWGGIQRTDVPEPSLETATAPSATGRWTYQFGGVNVAQCVLGTACIDTDLGKLFSYAADSSAVLLDDGVPLEAWASTLGVFVHRGTSPGDARLDDTGTDFGLSDDDLLERSANYQADLGCCGYDPQIALDGTSHLPVIAWYSNAERLSGVLMQVVEPGSGNPSAVSYRVPGTQSGTGPRARTPLAGRPGRSDLFTAATVGDNASKVVEQRFSIDAARELKRQPEPIVISRGSGEVRNVNVAADHKGRVWVVWTRRVNTGIKVFAVRSNRRVSGFGNPVSFKPPPRTQDSFALDASADGGGLDLFGTFSTGATGQETGIWYTRVSAQSGKRPQVSRGAPTRRRYPATAGGAGPNPAPARAPSRGSTAAPTPGATAVDYSREPGGTVLSITGGANADAITVSASGNTITIKDTGVGGIKTGDPDCAQRSSITVTCPLDPPNGSPVRKVDLVLGDGADRFTNRNLDAFVDEVDVHATGVKTIASGPGPDQLRLGSANDVVNTGGGADFVDAGPGRDRVATGGGDDDYASDAGADRIDLGAGDDVVRGRGFADGPDSLNAGSGPGDAIVFSGAVPVAMTLDGRADDGHPGEGDNLAGFEQFTGTNGRDTIVADGSANFIRGQGGPDRISAGGGADDIDPGRGDDSVDAGSGNDFVDQSATDDGADHVIGGAGNDFVDYCCGSAPVNIAEDGAANDGHPGEGDSLTGLEGLEGGDGADTLTGTDSTDAIYGFGGDDTLRGLGGADQLFGGGGDDVLVGGDGRDALDCEKGYDAILADPADHRASGCERLGAKIASRKARVTRGKALVKVSCPRSQDSRCKGKVLLRHKGHTAHARFRIRSGKVAKVRVRLSKALRKALRSHHGRIRVKALAETKQLGGLSVREKRVTLRSDS